MTILVGMTGTDGIILAADQCMVRPARSAVEYDDRMDTCKIVHLQKHKVAYAGVGDSVTRDVGRELSAILDSDGFDFGYIAGSLEQVAKDVVNRAKAETEPPDVFDDDRPRSLLIVFYGDQITALSENLTKQPLLRNFLHPLNREELDVGHRHPLGLQQQIPQVLIAPAAVNQHTNVPVHRFHHSEAYLRAAVVHYTFEVFEQHVGQLLKRRQPLPFQSVHPPPEIIQHGPWIFVVP